MRAINLDDSVPAEVIAAIRELGAAARGAATPSREDGDAGADPREAAIRAVGARQRRAGGDRQPLRASHIVGQMRLAAVDLLRAGGTRRATRPRRPCATACRGPTVIALDGGRLASGHGTSVGALEELSVGFDLRTHAPWHETWTVLVRVTDRAAGRAHERLRRLAPAAGFGSPDAPRIRELTSSRCACRRRCHGHRITVGAPGEGASGLTSEASTAPMLNDLTMPTRGARSASSVTARDSWAERRHVSRFEHLLGHGRPRDVRSSG